MFKAHIKPEWEDPRNVAVGRCLRDLSVECVDVARDVPRAGRTPDLNGARVTNKVHAPLGRSTIKLELWHDETVTSLRPRRGRAGDAGARARRGPLDVLCAQRLGAAD